MKPIKILLLLLFPLIAELFVSCCDCPEVTTEFYSNQFLEIDHLDNSGSVAIITNGPSVPKQAYGIQMRLGLEKVACNPASRTHFISTSYAFQCDCPPPETIARDSVTTLEIFTTNDFDETHPANTDVSDYFKIFVGSTYASIDDIIPNLSRIYYYELESVVTTELLLMTPPTLNESHSFKVILTLSDGRTFEASSSPIILN
jgi:hypothetical protein